jgi:hypothetical protein
VNDQKEHLKKEGKTCKRERGVEARRETGILKIRAASGATLKLYYSLRDSSDPSPTRAAATAAAPAVLCASVKILSSLETHAPRIFFWVVSCSQATSR